MARRYRTGFMCPNCSTLYKKQEDGDACCPAEQVYFCGRRQATKVADGKTRQYLRRFHFERSGASACRRRNKPITGCYVEQ